MQGSQPARVLRVQGSEFQILKKSLLGFSENFLKKSQKKVICQKLKRFEQSYLEAIFATPESTLTASNYRVKNFKF